jgi:hypothetical protein
MYWLGSRRDGEASTCSGAPYQTRGLAHVRGSPVMTWIHRLPRGDAGSPTPTKDYQRRVRIACNDLHGNPLDEAARAAMRELVNDGPTTAVLQQWER